MNPVIDIVTVVHCENNYNAHLELRRGLNQHADLPYRLIVVDNREDNRGFAKGCNVGAREGSAGIIGFLNPDTRVLGKFMAPVLRVMLSPQVVITGSRFGKPQDELDVWGVTDWVCGAAMFVRRKWFEEVGGFDEQFFLFYEETDLIRRAENQGRVVKSIDLPLFHQSPLQNSEADHATKSIWMAKSRDLYEAKWNNSATQ